MSEVPYPVHNLDFKYSLSENDPLHHHTANISVELGHPHGKLDTHSVLDIETINNGGYGMNIAIQTDWNGEWGEITEVNRVRISIFGDYEQDELVKFLQRVGLLTIPVYGRMETSNEE